MLARLALLLIALLVLLAAPVARAQNDAFGPLPEPAPTPVPVPEPADADDGDVGRTTLYVIGAGLVVALAGLAWWISRDARRSLSADPARTVGARAAGGPRSRLEPEPERSTRRRPEERQAAKARARAKGRVARESRKRNR